MKTRLAARKENYAASVKINMPDHFSPASHQPRMGGAIYAAVLLLKSECGQ
jgi:hypothetical protein